MPEEKDGPKGPENAPALELTSLAKLKLEYQVLFRSHLFKGPSTADVLGQTHDGVPRTLYDRLRTRRHLIIPHSPFASSFYMEPTLHPVSPEIGSATFNLSLSLWRELMLDHRGSDKYIQFLPQDIPNAHRVYLITSVEKRSVLSMGFPKKHWSLYTQGCFFNLGVIPSTGATSVNSMPGEKHFQALTQLKREFLVEKTPQGWQKVYTEHSDQAFTAFDLGLTQYSLKEVTILAQHVLDRMGRYNLVYSDCHAFVAFLAMRLVMSSRTSTVFMGKKAQIVDWDLKLDGVSDRSIAYYQSLQTGFVVRSPTARQERKLRPMGGFIRAYHLMNRIHEINELYKQAA